MIAVIFICCAALIVIGAARLLVWCLDRRDARIDADYRAARLVAMSRASFPIAEPDSVISDPYCRAGWEDAA